MSSLEKMKRDKKVRAMRTPYRLFYLSSIAAVLTIFGTTLFRFHNKKEQIKPTFQKFQKFTQKPKSLLQKIFQFIFRKKK
jgi:hypothetical protein